MNAANHSEPSARSDFYLCLARAFMTPGEPALALAMRDLLAGDLADMAGELDLAIEPWLADFREQAARLANPEDWLQVYSAIFLTPLAPARINTGHYLDGAMNGGSVRAMELAYLQCGVQRDEGFHDLSDHVAVQLEFVGWLYAQRAWCIEGEPAAEPPPVDPGHFLHGYVMRWVDRFCADLAGAAQAKQLPANPYLPLARILAAAVAKDAVAPAEDYKAVRRQEALRRARAKSAARGITADDLAEIRRKLEQRGLPTDHLPVSVEASLACSQCTNRSVNSARSR